ncbi:MAG: murein peptide amidase A [Chloroflexaceae bacterium]|nr:murein peptide amidase A [Chloroflexaceae bacterium]
MTRSSGYSLRNARLFRVWSIFVLLSTVLVLLWTPVTPTLAMPSTGMYVIGHSVQGRPIQAIRFGTGSRIVVITGAIHGGTETNTADLVNRLVARFETEDVRLPADLSLYLVPMINPDGVAHNTRYNANRVDLNRNWPTDDWQPDSVDASGVVPGGGGSAPLSEPESQALATWLLNLRQQPANRHWCCSTIPNIRRMGWCYRARLEPAPPRHLPRRLGTPIPEFTRNIRSLVKSSPGVRTSLFAVLKQNCPIVRTRMRRPSNAIFRRSSACCSTSKTMACALPRQAFVSAVVFVISGRSRMVWLSLGCQLVGCRPR